MKILSFINILCFSNKAINLTELRGLFSSSVPSPCFPLVTWRVCTGLHLALLVQQQKKTRGPSIKGLPTDLAAEVRQPTDQDRMVFPNRLQKASGPGRLEAFLKELSSHPSAAWSATFKHLNSVFRPKRSITLPQALHFIPFPYTETSLFKL